MEEMIHRLIIGRYRHHDAGVLYVGLYTIDRPGLGSSQAKGKTIDQFVSNLPHNYKFMPMRANKSHCKEYLGLEVISEEEFELLQDAVLCRNKGVLRFPIEKVKEM